MKPEGWYKDAVAYQVYTRSFQDSNGDGIGDLRGVVSRLDELAWLGVDLLWLSPFCDSPNKDNGYDVSDYTAVIPEAGTLDDLRLLIKEARARGIALMMDLVLNHSSDQHPWFLASRSSKDDPHRDWYFWADGKKGGPPNNWKSYFGGPAWTLDPATGQWYLHHFFPEQPDLNWETPALRKELYDAIRFWQDEGIDAFRLDAIHHIGKPRGLPDAPVTGGLWGQLLQYKNTPETHRHLADLNREVWVGRGAFTVGETGGTTPATSRPYTDKARGELDTIFHFDHVHHLHEWTAAQFRTSLLDWAATLAAGDGWDCPFFSNHDMPRHLSAFGDDGRWRTECAKAFAGLLLTQWGTPFLYQGEELGMANVEFASMDDYRDDASKAWYRDRLALGQTEAEAWDFFVKRTRDNARTPYQWDASPNAGFTTGTPWIGVNPDHEAVNWAAQRADPRSVLAFYRDLIALRKAEPVLRYGTTSAWGYDHDTVLAFLRSDGTKTLAVLCQLASKPGTWKVPRDRRILSVVRANTSSTKPPVPGTALNLRPWEFLLLELEPIPHLDQKEER